MLQCHSSSQEAGPVEPAADPIQTIARPLAKVQTMVRRCTRARLRADEQLQSLKPIERRARRDLHFARLRITKKSEKIQNLEAKLARVREELTQCSAVEEQALAELESLLKTACLRRRQIAQGLLSELCPEYFDGHEDPAGP